MCDTLFYLYQLNILSIGSTPVSNTTFSHVMLLFGTTSEYSRHQEKLLIRSITILNEAARLHVLVGIITMLIAVTFTIAVEILILCTHLGPQCYCASITIKQHCALCTTLNIQSMLLLALTSTDSTRVSSKLLSLCSKTFNSTLFLLNCILTLLSRTGEPVGRGWSVPL